jgi:hypothetical protein
MHSARVRNREINHRNTEAIPFPFRLCVSVPLWFDFEIALTFYVFFAARMANNAHEQKFFETVSWNFDGQRYGLADDEGRSGRMRRIRYTL